MKYIITESKLNKVIDRFIDYSLSDISIIKKDQIHNFFLGSSEGTYDRTIYAKKDGTVVLVIIENKEKSVFYVDMAIIKRFASMFNKKSFEIADYIKPWGERTLGHDPDMVFPLYDDDYRVFGDY